MLLTTSSMISMFSFLMVVVKIGKSTSRAGLIHLSGFIRDVQVGERSVVEDVRVLYISQRMQASVHRPIRRVLNRTYSVSNHGDLKIPTLRSIRRLALPAHRGYQSVSSRDCGVLFQRQTCLIHTTPQLLLPCTLPSYLRSRSRHL